MGIHFLRPDLLGITGPPSPRVNGTGTHTDFTKPAVLIYEPQADDRCSSSPSRTSCSSRRGRRRGTPRRRRSRACRTTEWWTIPTTVDEAHMFEPHYDRHVWIYRDNPNGMFAQFNPNATCKYHKGGTHKH